MPVCQNCKKAWSFQESFVNLLKMNRMTCSHCGKNQYLTSKSRRKMTFFGIVPLIPLFFSSFFQFPVYVYLLLSVLIFIGCMAIAPKFIDLSNEEEPLF